MPFLTQDDIVNLHNNLNLPQGDLAIINQGALTAAVQSPQQQYYGGYVNESVLSQSYVMARELAQSHPFVDGNKRTATAAVALFLQRNGTANIVATDLALRELVNRLADINPIERAEWNNELRTIIQNNQGEADRSAADELNGHLEPDEHDDINNNDNHAGDDSSHDGHDSDDDHGDHGGRR